VNFLTFLEKIGRERQVSFEATDFITLDLLNREENFPNGRGIACRLYSSPELLNVSGFNHRPPAKPVV
jgi:hypothetical protein